MRVNLNWSTGAPQPKKGFFAKWPPRPHRRAESISTSAACTNSPTAAKVLSRRWVTASAP